MNALLICRVGLHDGEHVGTLCGTEGFAADAAAAGEWHPLRHLPLLHRGQGQQPPWPPQRVHQGKQQSHGDARLERVRSSHALMGADWTGHQHLLAQLLPGEEASSKLRQPKWTNNVLSQKQGCSLWGRLNAWAKAIKACSVGGARQMYYLKRSKQAHNGPFSTPLTIDFLGHLSIHGNLFSARITRATSPFPILKTHFHLSMHMTAGRGKVISHLPGY